MAAYFCLQELKRDRLRIANSRSFVDFNVNQFNCVRETYEIRKEHHLFLKWFTFFIILLQILPMPV